MKKFVKISIFLILFGLCTASIPATAEEGLVDLYFFWGIGCPHCAKEKLFLADLELELPYLKVHSYEVWQSNEGREVLIKLSQESNLSVSGVPIAIVGSQVVYGYGSDETTGAEIRAIIEKCRLEQCPDIVAKIIGDEADGLETAVEAPTTPNPEEPPPGSGIGSEETAPTSIEQAAVPEKINVPFFGGVNIKNFSLPFLTFIIGALDGFNPCAMWVLVFLISLLLGVPSIKRRWILGLVFIFASALVYFLFLAAWLNIFLFLGFIVWVRIVVGILAVIFGAYNIKDFWTNREGTCKVTYSETRRRIMNYLKDIALGKKLFVALIGIVLIAFAVNLIELLCSAGFPAIYTQVLALSNLPGWLYYLYLLEYIFFFMIDDMIVFIVAMVTLQLTGLSGKYARYTTLIGGIIILTLGILLMFKPGWLMFGG